MNVGMTTTDPMPANNPQLPMGPIPAAHRPQDYTPPRPRAADRTLTDRIWADRMGRTWGLVDGEIAERYRLLFGVRGGTGKLYACGNLYFLTGFVAVEPVFTRFIGLDNGMARCLEMLLGIVVRRAIAASHVPAFGTAAKVQPASPGIAIQALQTTRAGGLCFGVDALNSMSGVEHRRANGQMMPMAGILLFRDMLHDSFQKVGPLARPLRWR